MAKEITVKIHSTEQFTVLLSMQLLPAEIQSQRSLLTSPELWVSMDKFQITAGALTSGKLFPLY